MEVCQMHDSIVKRIEQCESKISNLESNDNDLNARQVRVETKLDYIAEKIKDLSDKIDKISERPGKRWDNVITALAIAAITGLATAFFMRGGH